MDGVYRAGDLLHGYQAVADNLPNDPRIREEKGSEEDLLEEFHGRARELSSSARAPRDASGPGRDGER